jgi:hypothetical protein
MIEMQVKENLIVAFALAMALVCELLLWMKNQLKRFLTALYCAVQSYLFACSF